jgi:hypothetical protein
MFIVHNQKGDFIVRDVSPALLLFLSPTDPSSSSQQNKKQNTPWLLVPKRIIPTPRPSTVGDASADFADRGVSRGQRDGSPGPLISVF